MASGASNTAGDDASTPAVMESSIFTPGSGDNRAQIAQSLLVVERGRERFFDDLVGEVSFVVGMPFCFVCFVGREAGRVHVKAACGEIPDTLPSMWSFIEDVIEHPQQLLCEVLDARATSTYSMDELVLFPPHLRYFAGAQVVHSGVAIGGLFVADGALREPLSAENAAYLEQSAQCIGEYLAAAPLTG